MQCIFPFQIESITPEQESECEITYADILEGAGFRKVLRTANIDEAVCALRLHFGFYVYLPSLVQFSEGELIIPAQRCVPC